MENIKKINNFGIALPFILLFLGMVFNKALIMVAFLSTMLTGFIQLIIAAYILMNTINKRPIIIYFLLVIAFFLLWYYNDKIHYSELLNLFLVIIPVLLCIYLTILIYKLKVK